MTAKLAKGIALAATFVTGAIGLSSLASAAACPTGIDVTGNTNYVQFGDGLSYALPILGIDVQSSPGQIKDCIVVATGAGGAVERNGLSGLADNAYQNVQGDQNPYFRTGDTTLPNNTDPGGAGQFTGDSATTWDIRISALESFLNGGDLMFYFNHNQTNSGGTIDQDLFVWGQIILRNDAGDVIAVYDFTAIDNTLLFPNFGEPGGDPTLYTSAGVAGGTYPSGPDAGFPQTSDFVRARGQLCLDGPAGTGNIVDCSDPSATDTFNMNLGANNVANAVIFPELNALLASAGNGGATVMQIDFRMGCNAAQVVGGTCIPGSVLNNGYEQLFITSTVPTTFIPEPGTVALLGLGLLGLFAHARKRQLQA